MRILQINIRVNKGSVSRITEQIGLKVLEQGWDSYIAYGRPSNPSKSKTIQIGTYNNVKWHYLMSNLTDRHGLFSTNATKKLVEEIKQLHPDIIHLQNIHGYYLNYRVLFEYLNSINIPVVWTLHDCWSFTGHCSHFVTVGCDKWKTGCYNCPLTGAYPRSLFFDCSKKNYELKKRLFSSNKNLHIVTVSEWLAGLVRQSFLKNCDIRVIHNGIDLSVFYPRDYHKHDRFKIIGVASVWNKDKGLNDFFELRKRLELGSYEITLIGLTKEQLKHLPDGLTGVQRTDTVDELAEYYSDADVFVNLTYADTFPSVNIEALACGTPVITYRTGGSPEILDEHTGIVVNQGDISGLLKAIDSIKGKTWGDKEKQRKCCRSLTESKYDKNKCFDEYISLYNKLRPGGGKFIIVGCATVWNEAKGLMDYFALSKVLDDDCQIILVGVSEQIQNKLPANIIGIPKTDSIDMLAHVYSIADVVTSLSYAETFGMTIVESMACGTPVIAYNNTAQRELIDNHCGVVVPTGNIDAIKLAISKIKANGKAYYYDACVKKANNLFNINERYNDYIKLYKELCDSKK